MRHLPHALFVLALLFAASEARTQPMVPLGFGSQQVQPFIPLTTISGMSIVDEGTYTVDLTPNPFPAYCATILGVKASVRVTLHIGGDADLYRFGTTAFSATVRGKLVAYVGTTPTVLEPEVVLSINQTKPEATFLCTDTRLIENSAYIDRLYKGNAPTGPFDEIRFELTPEEPLLGFETDLAANSEMRLALRLELDYEHDLRATQITTPLVETFPDLQENTFASFTGVSGNAPISLLTNSRVRLSWHAANPSCANDLDCVMGWQIQVARLYNSDISNMTNPYVVTGTLDWQNALTLTTAPNVDHVDVTLAEGEGVYVFRVRPVIADEEHSDQAREGYGEWSVYPTDPLDPNGPVTINAGQCEFGDWTTGPLPAGSISVFYHKSETSRNRSYERNAASEISRPLVNAESMSFMDAVLTPRQNQSLNAAADNIIVSEQFTDHEGRPLAGSLPAPLSTRQMGFQTLLNAVGSAVDARPYDSRHFDVYDPSPGNNTIINPTEIAASLFNTTGYNGVSWYYSNENPDLQIPSAGNFPTSRTILNGEGRVSKVTLPGEIRRSGSASGAHQRILYGSVSDIELTSIFGNEAPAASSVTKTISISPDNVSSVTYTDVHGKVIASCLVGSAEIATSKSNGMINGDGTGRLLNLNGNTGSTENSILEKVNELNIKFELQYGVETTPGRFVASKRIVVPSATVLSLVYEPFYKRVDPDLSCSNYCFKCDWNTVVQATLIDPLPMKRIGATIISPPEAMIRICTLPQGNLNQTPTITLPYAGTWLIERIVTFNNNVASNSNTWRQEHEQKALDYTRPLQAIYGDVFNEPSAESAEDKLLAYKNYYATNNLVNYYEGGAQNPWCKLTLPELIPCPVDVCETVNGVDPRIEEYFIEQWLLSQKLDASDDAITAFKAAHTINILFRKDAISGTEPTLANRVYENNFPYDRGWNIFEQMITNMIASGYECEAIWKAWRATVAMKLSGTVGTSGGNADVLDIFLNIVGRRYTGIHTAGTWAQQYYPPETAWAYHAYELVWCDNSQTCNQCIPKVEGAPLYYTVADGPKYYNAIAACFKTGEVASRDYVESQYLDDPLTEDPMTIATRAELNERLLENCQRSCSGKWDYFLSELKRIHGATKSEAELYCLRNSLMEECQQACRDGFPTENMLMGTQAQIQDAVNRTFGVPKQTNPVNGVCPEGYDDAIGAPGTSLLQSLAVYLTAEYEKLQKTATTKQCVNVAQWIRTFLLGSMADAEIPLCIRDAAALTVTSTDCGLNPDEAERRFFVTILPGKSGRFYTATDENDSCENCTLIFEGPTDYITNHLLPQKLNQLLDDIWGMSILDLGTMMMPIHGASTQTDSADRIYYKNWMVTENGLDLVPPLQTRVTHFLWDAYTVDEGVNGSPGGLHPVWTTTVFPYATEDYARPPIALFIDDRSFFSIVDTTKSTVDSAWLGHMRHFSTTGLTFGIHGDPLGLKRLVWGLERDTTSDTVLQSVRWLQHGGQTLATTSFSSSPTNDEIRPFTDTTFTQLFGSFGQTAQGVLTFNDLRMDETVEIRQITFYRRKTRILMGADVNCLDVDLCAKAPCMTCVEYKIVKPSDMDYTRGRDRTPRPCADEELARLKNEIAKRYSEMRRITSQKVTDAYDKQCLDIASFHDKLSVSYSEDYYHYTLAYYDRAGRLQRTVPPRGVDIDKNRTRSTRPNHSMVTTFSHSSLSEQRTQDGPDVGTTKEWANAKGLTRFRQNADQGAADPRRLSYFIYDKLARQIETGELDVPAGTTLEESTAEFVTDHIDVDVFIEDNHPDEVEARRDVIRTVYSAPASLVTAGGGAIQTAYPGIYQKRLRGRVSWTETIPDLTIPTTDVVRSFYSYDAHGNIDWAITDIPRNNDQASARVLKKTDYVYDLTLGVVEAEWYQKGEVDQFIHRYFYDVDGRVTDAYTSRDAVNWDRDAHYIYKSDGQLARVVLGEDEVQGVDYTFTLDGSLKGINHPSPLIADDPGLDGGLGTENTHIPHDAFGIAFSYYDGDFNRTYDIVMSPFHDANTVLLGAPTSLYAGQIGAVTYRTHEITPGVVDIARDGALIGEQFVYDRLGRLRQTTSSLYGTGFTSDGTGGWASTFIYDPHGNQLAVKRSVVEPAGTSVVLDDIDVTVHDESNTPASMAENPNAGIAGFTGDLNDMDANQSVFDDAGRATILSDDNHATHVVWNSRHEATRITLGTHEQMRILRDANGDIVRFSTNNANGEHWYMVPGGARYSGTGTGAPTVVEWPIVGPHGRIGVSRDVAARTTVEHTYERFVQTHFYELTDNVGSVRAIVADIRQDAAHQTTPVLAGMSDYDAYGLVRPNRSQTTALLGEQYIYAFQGMQSMIDVGGDDMYTTPFRLYDARRGSWMSSDPLFHSGESAYLGLAASPMTQTDPLGLYPGNDSDPEDVFPHKKVQVFSLPVVYQFQGNDSKISSIGFSADKAWSDFKERSRYAENTWLVPQGVARVMPKRDGILDGPRTGTDEFLYSLRDLYGNPENYGEFGAGSYTDRVHRFGPDGIFEADVNDDGLINLKDVRALWTPGTERVLEASRANGGLRKILQYSKGRSILGKRMAHTDVDHIGKTISELGQRIATKGLQKASSFYNETIAALAAATNIAISRRRVVDWLKSSNKAPLEITGMMDLPVGVTLFKDGSTEVTKVSTTVLVKDASSEFGYYVFTSYPGIK